jgi:hypothetical protein
VGSFSGLLMLAESSHTSVVKLADPFGKDCGFIGTGYVETEGPPCVSFIPLRAVGIGDFIVFDASLQHLDLPPKLNSFLGMGFLDLADSADSSTQYSPESGGIKVGDFSEEGFQGSGRDRDWGQSGRPGDLAIVLATGVSRFLGGHDGQIGVTGGEWEGKRMQFIAAVRPLLCSRGFDR